jgi:aspartate-semialdehyde dehydrogenase
MGKIRFSPFHQPFPRMENPMQSIAIVGANGAIGQAFLQFRANRSFPAPTLYGSERSQGKRLLYGKDVLPIQPFRAETVRDFSTVFLFTGESFSLQWAPFLADQNRIVIDSSPAWRLSPQVPMILHPFQSLCHFPQTRLFALPNCSTAILLAGLFPLHREFTLRGFSCCTYQSVSGSGNRGMETLKVELADSHYPPNRDPQSCYGETIGHNVLPAIGDCDGEGRSGEEISMERESQKILQLPGLSTSITCVRIPILRGHGLAVSAFFEKSVDVARAREVLLHSDHLDFCESSIPTPLRRIGSPRCALGRLRENCLGPNGLDFWITGDQLLCPLNFPLPGEPEFCR